MCEKKITIGFATMGLPGTKAQKDNKKWKQIK